MTFDEIVAAVEESYGEVIDSEEQCPGVYYLACRDDEYTPPRELLVVERDCPHISEAVKAYGEDQGGSLLVFNYNDLYSGKQLVLYEALRYRALHGLSPLDGETMRSVAACAADTYPDYFGTIPAPIQTPQGYMTRYMTLLDGIFAIETDAGVRLIAIAGIIWSVELQDTTIALGGKAGNLPEELAYLFFNEQNGCLALFELLHSYPKLRWCPKLDWRALMNAIWTYHPDYALAHNLREQQGLNDLLGLALNDAEIETELSGAAENMVVLSSDTEHHYLRW